MSYVIAFVAGLFLWTFLEYAIHNWVGHIPKGRHHLSREHLAHHKQTNYFTPGVRKAIAATPVLSLTALAVWPFAGLALGVTVAAGLAAGWTAYEVLHRRIHTHAPLNAYGRWARRHHLHHHFTRPFKNHGVTTPIWDLVFGTYEQPSVIKVPRRHAGSLPWLASQADPAQVATPFAEEYRIV